MSATPGPWTAFATLGSTTYAVRGADDELVAAVDTPNSAENARLIAAAPQMLEVLTLLARGYGVTFQDAALRSLMQDAIAKATEAP